MQYTGESLTEALKKDLSDNDDRIYNQQISSKTKFEIRKKIPPAERVLLYAKLFVYNLEELIKGREKLLNKNKRLGEKQFKQFRNDNDVHIRLVGAALRELKGKLEPEVHYRLIDFLMPELGRKLEKYQLNAHAFSHWVILDYCGEYIYTHGNNDDLKERLKIYQELVRADRGESYILEDIDVLLKGDVLEGFEKVESKKVKPLLEKDLNKKKKWLWLQEHKLAFIPDRNSFIQLICTLSTIDYSDSFEVPADCRKIMKEIDSEGYEVFILDLYNSIIKEGKKRSAWFVSDKSEALKIMLWILFDLKTKNRFSILTKLADKCFEKIPRVGPTSRKVGDHILSLFYNSQEIEGLGALLNLRTRAKYPVFRDALKNAINLATCYTGLQPEEVEDYFISDHGLEDNSVAHAFGEYSSAIRIEGYNKVILEWFKPNGDLQKSVPAAVKNNFPNELKLWKAKQKDIKKDLSGQRMRLESSWINNKVWSLADWEKYLLNHPLLASITRTLIWNFKQGEETKTGIYCQGKLQDLEGRLLVNSPDTEVRLWHPVECSAQEVLAWRNFMMDKEIKQAFKQAYREVYILTDAERTTNTYSNRFLKHVLRHPKVSALFKQRLWTYAGMYDHSYPLVDYNRFKMRSVLEIQNEYEFIITGQLKFWNLATKKQMTLEEVPTLIFSETLRDVDLFVGVCTIGLEEEWKQNQYQSYWDNYSKSDLSETSKTRKVVLENLIPRLKIGPQCSFSEKHLIVKGSRRTYKIHLGSGNILMEPNDQYLCIVLDGSGLKKQDNYFIPFDDDVTLSVILSKAFLLAEDEKIKDETILSQIAM